MNPSQPLDKDIINLAKAMRQVESGNKAVLPQEGAGFGGKSRYQYSNDTWKEVAGKYLGNPNAELNLQNENQATYKRIEDWKKQGKNVGQIASMWNAGEGEPDAYLGTFSTGKPSVGVNEYGVKYDVPSHARKVAEEYRRLKGSNLGGTYTQPPQTKPFTPAEQTGVETLTDQVGAGGGFIGDLGQAFSTAGTKGSDAMQRGFRGESDPFSAAYQTAGAGAGAVGDVVDATLSNLPIVGGLYKGATDMIGGAVQGAMNTEAGQKITEMTEGFSPDTKRNIGATLDLVSVIPFFKALKLGKRGFTDAVTGVTASKVTRQATDEIEDSLTKGTQRNLDRAKGRGLDPIKTILDDPKLIPDIIEKNGKYIYDTKEGVRTLQQSIEASELALQNLFASTIKQNVGVNLNDVRQQVLRDVMPKGKINVNSSAIKRELNRLFDDVAASAGRNFVSLSDLNDIKRQIRSGINFDAIDPTRALSRQVQFDAGQSLMRQVEKIAAKAGIKGVPELNKTMGGQLTAMDILEDLGGKAIKSGAKGKDGLIKSVARTIPGVEGIVDYASRGVPLTATRRLKDRRPLRETGLKGLSQLAGGVALSGQLTSE